jgi:hypothetical protein
MRVERRTAALAGLSIAFAIALISGSSARASFETIWPECTSGSATQTCKESGWYTSSVVVVWRASSAPEHTSPCELGIGYPFEADGVANVECSAKWKGAGSETTALTLHIEVSAPTIEAIPERPPDSHGWYNHPVAVTFKGQGYSGPATCQAAGGPSATAVYSGPDTASATVSGTCVDPAGKSASMTFGLRYDATKPTITGAYATRPPDFNGWYNHPVTFAFTGTDAISGMEPCSATYSGPEGADATLTATCYDGAGNAATFAVSLGYEATPPPLRANVSAGDGVVSLHWKANSQVEIIRSPGLRGPHASTLYSGTSGSFTDTHCRNGVRYTYTLRTRSRAGVATDRSISVTPGPQLLAPAENALATTPPVLRWTPVKGASYYNVQLYRGHKLLSVWPVHTSVQLSRSWQFDGSEHRLAPGRYSWYVWPGYGPFHAAHYGAPIGHRTFTIHSTTSTTSG